ncbi:MAG: hypothetical protein M3Q07_23330, partial [Pseudobdellovibrionaceae bacterium]|nr:hypothetical protein [Pseudobdellovibrionaceae bacterium]
MSGLMFCMSFHQIDIGSMAKGLTFSVEIEIVAALNLLACWSIRKEQLNFLIIALAFGLDKN